MKNLLLISAFLLFFTVGCNDDSEPDTSQNPIESLELPSGTDPLTAGEPVLIKGKGFTASDQIWLKPATGTDATNSIQATITEITDASITITVPDDTDGVFEIFLQRDGREYSLGKLTFTVKEPEETAELYVFKIVFDSDDYIVKIDPTDGSEQIIATLDAEDFDSPVYYPATGEIFGLDDTELLKLNISTGQITSVDLNLSEDDGYYEGLVLDNDHQLYAFKRVYDDSHDYIVKIDPADGSEQIIATLDAGDFDSPVYYPVTGEIFSLDETILHKLKISTGQSISVDLNLSEDDGYYDGLVLDNDHQLYAFKRVFESGRYIVKIDPADGSEQIIVTLDAGHFDSPVYYPATGEIIGLDETKLLKLNLSTGQITSVDLNLSEDNGFYEGLVVRQMQ